MIDFIFVTGPPGAGKGTLCSRLVHEANEVAKTQDRPSYYHLSIGDYLRKLKRDGTLPNALQQKLDQQQTLSAQEFIPILRDQIDVQERDGCGVLILDGFPRSWKQLEAFEAELGAPKLFIRLDCAREVALARVFRRDDTTRNATTASVFMARFEEYEQEQPAIAAHYAAIGLSLKTGTMEGDNEDQIGVVYQKLRTLIQSYEAPTHLVFGSSH